MENEIHSLDNRISMLEQRINPPIIVPQPASCANFGAMQGNVWTEEFFNLPVGASITTLEVKEYQRGGDNVRIKLYADDSSGGYPSTLLGESGSIPVPAGGPGKLINFTFTTPVAVPSDNRVWAGIETDTSALNLCFYKASGNLGYVSHTYGSGPSPFGTFTSYTPSPLWEQLFYTATPRGNKLNP